MSKEEAPISVIIPTFNCAQFLAQAVDSVLAQTTPPQEVIVVDDGSTDETATLIEKYKDKLNYVRQHNAGPSSARNHGIQLAKCEYLAFLDADDIWDESALSTMFSAFQRFPSAGLISADQRTINAHSEVIEASWGKARRPAKSFAAGVDRPLTKPATALMECNSISTSMVMLKKSLVNTSGAFREDIRFGEDLELWIRIAFKSDVVVLSNTLGSRRTHANNTTKATEKLLRDLLKVARVVDLQHREAYLSEGTDSRRLVTEAMLNLAYWLIRQNRRKESLTLSCMALATKPDLRGLKTLVTSVLPTKIRRLFESQSTTMGPK